jgi:putative endonuclease
MKREIQPAVYMLASARNGTLYIGVTSNLVQRIWQHREGVVEGFTTKYHVKTLVWYEQHDTMESAITREKSLKTWNRDWKLRLIETANPNWCDLWREILGEELIHAPQSADHDPLSGRHSTPPVRRAAIPDRHSRIGGNPEPGEAATSKALDSRLRGNDGEVR